MIGDCPVKRRTVEKYPWGVITYELVCLSIRGSSIGQVRSPSRFFDQAIYRLISVSLTPWTIIFTVELFSQHPIRTERRRIEAASIVNLLGSHHFCISLTIAELAHRSG